MEAKELMLYDWIAFSGSPFQVKTLKTNGVIELMYPDGATVTTTSSFLEGASNVRPIPLTAEILEKNGFTYNDVPFIYSWEKDGFCIDENDGVHRTLAIQTNVSAEMQYIHQLQQALRLCGLWKMADNFKI